MAIRLTKVQEGLLKEIASGVDMSEPIGINAQPHIRSHRWFERDGKRYVHVTAFLSKTFTAIGPEDDLGHGLVEWLPRPERGYDAMGAWLSRWCALTEKGQAYVNDQKDRGAVALRKWSWRSKRDAESRPPGDQAHF